MSTLQSLTLKRNAALGKLRALQIRAERLTGPDSSVATQALSQLESALDEMLVATEHLQTQISEAAAARDEAEAALRRFLEFAEAVPLPCVWTTREGEIAHANPAAAELLNVSAQRLSGRPLLLFLADRPAFEQAVLALNQGISRMVVIDIHLRPRERRPRRMRLSGRRMTSDEHHCWFITEVAAASKAASADVLSHLNPRPTTV